MWRESCGRNPTRLPHERALFFLDDHFPPASQAKLNIYDLGIVLRATRTFLHRPFRAEVMDVSSLVAFYRASQAGGRAFDSGP